MALLTRPSLLGASALGASEELAEVAARAQARLAGAHAEEIIEWAVERFGPRFCVTSSMADGVLAHLASRVAPGVDIVFLDTGYHFQQTLAVRDRVAATMPVHLLSITPPQTVAEQDATHGPRLFERDPDQCCALRKVAPLEQALAGYDAWAAGVRRSETASRANTREVDFESARGKVKIAPLVRWTDADVAAYIEWYDIPVNRLFAEGYGSIGCWPCTRRVAPGEDPRAGRWAMFDKTECGLHTSPLASEPPAAPTAPTAPAAAAAPASAALTAPAAAAAPASAAPAGRR